jgi:hypothetical protein
VEPHVESMNYFLTEGMHTVVDEIKPLEVSTHTHTHAVTTKAWVVWQAQLH